MNDKKMNGVFKDIISSFKEKCPKGCNDSVCEKCILNNSVPGTFEKKLCEMLSFLQHNNL